ncbi:hypothetical protein DL98DRAFT_131582 [Cadophora sp. DSE1049]|nr:hypothetical protein DL98DRAFT_131582 [Cadophora sp. DSE1049]
MQLISSLRLTQHQVSSTHPRINNHSRIHKPSPISDFPLPSTIQPITMPATPEKGVLSPSPSSTIKSHPITPYPCQPRGYGSPGSVFFGTSSGKATINIRQTNKTLQDIHPK